MVVHFLIGVTTISLQVHRVTVSDIQSIQVYDINYLSCNFERFGINIQEVIKKNQYFAGYRWLCLLMGIMSISSQVHGVTVSDHPST